ncbi:hypothetical protein R5W23_002221 [Gemmata sp. JC673]|uniref:DUF3999 family protein n=1 Tax=Gemmata algarum TaxID=2975278 RepID=A0ABU5F2K7_9BACT|nr:hypothetical protein [Gemmata algarum]MDY3560972.1 hypothetical protein [Gemmata algarum]
MAEHRQIWHRDRWRFRVESLSRSLRFPDRKSESVLVSDGTENRVLHKADKSGMVSAPVYAPIEEGFDYLSYFRSLDGMFELPDVFRKRLSAGAWVTRGPGGRLVLDLPPVEEKGLYDKHGFQLVVDPAQGFFPVEVRVLRLNPGAKTALRRLMTVEAFTRLPNGVTVPVKATTRLYNTSPGPELGQEDYSVTGEVDVAGSKWNVTPPDTTFRLGFPVGTVVHDTTRKVKFISGSSDPGSNVDQLIAQASEALPLGSAAEFQTVSKTWWRDWRWACGLVAALLVVGITALRLLRRGKAA